MTRFYANSILHIQTTGASTSVRAFWLPLRRGRCGRALRSSFFCGPAAKWNVDPATCQRSRGCGTSRAPRRGG